MFRSLCNDSEEYNLKASIHVYNMDLQTFNLRKYYLVQSVQISWLHYFVYYMYFNNINIFMSKLHEFRSIHKKNISQFYLNEIFDPFCCICLKDTSKCLHGICIALKYLKMWKKWIKLCR